MKKVTETNIQNLKLIVAEQIKYFFGFNDATIMKHQSEYLLILNDHERFEISAENDEIIIQFFKDDFLTSFPNNIKIEKEGSKYSIITEDADKILDNIKSILEG